MWGKVLNMATWPTPPPHLVIIRMKAGPFFIWRWVEEADSPMSVEQDKCRGAGPHQWCPIPHGIRDSRWSYYKLGVATNWCRVQRIIWGNGSRRSPASMESRGTGLHITGKGG